MKESTVFKLKVGAVIVLIGYLLIRDLQNWQKRYFEEQKLKGKK